jgi:hypothetical protein
MFTCIKKLVAAAGAGILVLIVLVPLDGHFNSQKMLKILKFIVHFNELYIVIHSGLQVNYHLSIT